MSTFFAFRSASPSGFVCKKKKVQYSTLILTFIYRRERHISNLKSRCQSVQEKNANVYEVPVNQQYIMRMYVHRKHLT